MIVVSPRMTLIAVEGQVGVQAIRLREGDVEDALETARSLGRVHGCVRASWWLSEHSTPADLEEALIALGLRRVEGDYELDGMCLAVQPPAVEGIEARRVRTLDEYVQARTLQFEAFRMPAERHPQGALAEEFELTRGSGVGATYAAWIDGRIAGAGRAFFSARGALLTGGATAEWARGRGAYRALVRARWDDAVARGTPFLAVQAGVMSAPILHRLGFETVCRFRRLEDVLSPP
jgi:hypothetical protein